jgi:diguanylate cyclase (GGDEF)-like protein/PAS domain S-box-containing protein
VNGRENPWPGTGAHAREQWSEFVDAMPDAVIVYDADLRYVALNRAAAEIYGCSPGELIGHTREQIVGLDEQAPRMREALAGSQPMVALNEVSTAAGRRIFETIYQRYQSGAGPVYLIGVAREITASRKQALLNEERLRSLFENNLDGIGVVDPTGIITNVNDAALSLLGYERSDLVGKPFAALFDPADVPRLWESFERSLRGEPLRIEARPRSKDGGYVELECTGSPVLSDGEVVGVYCALTDISARKRAERALQRQHQRIRELYLCATESNTTGDEQVRRTLELGCRMLGMETAAIYDMQSGTTIAVSAPGVAAGELVIAERLARAAMAAPDGLALDDPGGSGELLGAGDGTTFAAFVGVPVDVAGARFGSLCLATTTPREAQFEAADRDVVQLMGVLVGAEIERGRARLHLRSLAYYDALTGLPNRVLLKEQLEAALAAGRESGHRSAVLFLDLDRFKDVNDTFGHALGDRLLQLAAERITGCVRSSETVARMGGDEFIVVMPAIRQTVEATALAERLLRAIDQPFSIAGHEQYTTTSIGVALAPLHGTDSETLIKNADIAMYRAKDRGRNTYVLFAPELDRNTSLRVSNEQGMRRALEREEFTTFFQPILDAREGKIHGVEALARWQHPVLSLLRPDAFIATAETNGLIVRIGEVVLEEACRQVRAWHQAGFGDLHLAVNLSARQLHDNALVASLAAILERTGFPPHLLELEIAESAAMADAEATVRVMGDLKATGARTVLDDFGTGYSSLEYLRRFPLDGIKVDRSFVSGIGARRDDEAIVRAVVAMAHALGLQVVAAGVETAEQVEFLRRENCDRLQGHYYAAASPADLCDRYLRAWTSNVAGQAAAGP